MQLKNFPIMPSLHRCWLSSSSPIWGLVVVYILSAGKIGLLIVTLTCVNILMTITSKHFIFISLIKNKPIDSFSGKTLHNFIIFSQEQSSENVKNALPEKYIVISSYVYRICQYRYNIKHYSRTAASFPLPDYSLYFV